MEDELFQLNKSKDSNQYLSRKEIIKEIKDILGRSVHNINITAPTIADIGELELFEVQSRINIKVSCNISIGNTGHKEIVEQLEIFDNISLREYSDMDRFSILRDGEELFFAAIGENSDKFLIIKTEDSKHISLFNTLFMESWLRGRPYKR